MMVQFLKLEVVRGYVASMDDEVQHHLRTHWSGRATVSVMPSMKSLTFDIMCTVIFGLGREDHAAVRRELLAGFEPLVRGIWSIPVNLPFTTFGKCLAASQRGRRAVAGILKEKRAKLEKSMLNMDDHGLQALNDIFRVRKIMNLNTKYEKDKAMLANLKAEFLDKAAALQMGTMTELHAILYEY
jgi:cytochrome P450